MSIKPALSAYLDLLRFVAALSVLLGHMSQDGLFIDWMPLALFSHEAVVIFFVLSGFIIYVSTISRSFTWRQYTVSRLARIYSVALPAVLFCVLLTLWLSRQSGFDPGQFSNYAVPSLSHLISSLLFLNESWLNEADVPLNSPYWSLCYEVWYYVLFAVFIFMRGRKRWLWIAITSLLAGPAILVLLPVWAMGAWLAASGRYECRLSLGVAWAYFLLPLLLIVLVKLTDTDLFVRNLLHENVPGYWRLVSSQKLVTDILIGIMLCLHIAAFSSLPVFVQEFFTRFKKVLAELAGFSFTLYLFHRPMTQLLGAWYPQSEGAAWQTILMALGILLACGIISLATEKQLPLWRRTFSRVLLR